MSRIKYIVLIILLSVNVMAGGAFASEVEGLNVDTVVVELNQPHGIAVGLAGEIYIADTFDNTIKKIVDGNGEVIAGNNDYKDIYGFAMGGFADGDGLTAFFNRPRALVVSPEDVIFVADTGNHAIRKIQDGIVSTVAGNGSSGDSDGLMGEAAFNTPSGITMDADGNLYVADTLNNKIRMVDVLGNVTSLSLKDSASGIIELLEPTDVCMDDNGVLYIVDSGNHRILKVVDNQTQIIAGAGEGYVDGNVSDSKFAFPKSITTKDGLIFVSDTWNHVIRIIKPDGTVSTLAGNGGPGNESLFSEAVFNAPSGITTDGNKLLVADRWNDSVKEIDLNYGQAMYDLNYAFPVTRRPDIVDVFVNQMRLTYVDVEPLIVEGVWYYPLRFISESLGAEVTYNSTTREASILYNDKTISYLIDNLMIKNGRTLMPIRQMGTDLGFFITLDQATGDIRITPVDSDS